MDAQNKKDVPWNVSTSCPSTLTNKITDNCQLSTINYQLSTIISSSRWKTRCQGYQS